MDVVEYVRQQADAYKVKAAQWEAVTQTATELANTTEEHWGFCEAGVDFEHLQILAKFWLLRDDIVKAIKFADVGHRETHPDISEFCETLLGRV